ncbi:MAG: DsbE family thiol:disulfide interchange protein [Pseudomonadota bacterium]
MWRYSTPLLFFAGLVILFIFGLKIDPGKVPSPLIGKPAPAFEVSTVNNPTIFLNSNDIKGQVSLVNIWASWCAACLEEHPLLVEINNTFNLPIYGINYKDNRNNAIKWLKSHGNPYRKSAFDEEGKIGIEYGVYGVPETFILDKEGIIRYKHIGPIDAVDIEKTILPMINQLSSIP